MRKVLIVEGMSCGHCQKAVEKAVQALPGVQAAQVSLADKTLDVTYDESQLSWEAIVAAVEDEGYEVVRP